jgi:DNA polymerase III delta prime subunit
MKEYLWSEQERPKTIEDCILPKHLEETFLGMVREQTIPNLILSGSQGIGKTTIAKALIENIGGEWYMINGSLSGNIDTLRTDIKSYASTVSFTGQRKFVILDEADYLNANSTQPALRNFMESYSQNCGFILTCNYLNKIIEPLHSRCSIIEFKIPKEEKAIMADKFFKRCMGILEKNNIEYDKKVVAELIINYFPDFRRTINELQRYSINGKIDIGILSSKDYNFSELIELIKSKNYTSMRKWVGENISDFNGIYRKLYDSFSNKISNVSALVLIIAEYQYKATFVVDQEINLLACLTEIMGEVNFV